MSKRLTFAELEQVINESGVDEEVRRYSGRGMYGKECLAVATSSPIQLTADIVASVDDPVMRQKVAVEFSAARIDSLGTREILYFPAVVAPTGDE